ASTSVGSNWSISPAGSLLFREVTPERTIFGRARFSSGLNNPKGALQLLTPRPAHLDACSTLQLHLVVAARSLVQHLHQVQTHDRRAVHSHEHRRVESILQRLQRFTQQQRTSAYIQLNVGSARKYVINVRNLHHAHLATHVYRNALEPPVPRSGGRLTLEQSGVHLEFS